MPIDYKDLSRKVTDEVNNLLSFPPYDTMDEELKANARV